METASLRIKFTPLIQDFQKNDSKCCLEIVPEVTAIQNLDRIAWHQKSDFIEYTVPMTYKVILRKRQGEQGNCPNLEKVYHSCVDLLPTSSSMCIGIGGGDTMLRMISDTLIYDNFRATIDTGTTFANNGIELKSVTISNENFKDKQVDADVFILDKLLDELSTDNILSTRISNNVCSVTKVDASTSQLLTKDIDTADKGSAEKNDYSKTQLYKESKIELDDSGTEISTGSNKVGSLRKLSVTPIYSIDTIDNEIDRNIPFLSPCSTLKRFFKPQKMIHETLKIKELHDNNAGRATNITALKSIDYCSVQNKFCVYKRELPEVRVANFMKKMETEIMPLKIILHDIFKKCTTMGLIMNEGLRLKEHPITNKQLIKYCTPEKQTKFNRVVYSIVFDG